LANSSWLLAFGYWLCDPAGDVVAATAKQLAEQILHPAVSPRFDLGIQDGMSLGMAVLSLRAAIGRLAFTIWLYILALYKE
jgi:hypothetical protein